MFENYSCIVCGMKWSTSSGIPNIPLCNSNCLDKWDRKIDFEGTKIKVDEKATIQPGYIYLAIRNTGWKLLTCRENNNNIIFPVETAYPYNTNECYKVVDMEY